MTSKKVVGLLVIYYEKYRISAIDRFESLLKMISDDYSLIIIHNNPGASFVDGKPERSIHLEGDNSLREFSAWEKGASYCNQNNLLSEDGILVFANDTFCHHNKFGPLTRLMFVTTFKKMLRKSNELVMAGEVHCLGQVYTICGKSSSSWVSTYLFGMTSKLLQKTGRLTPKTDLNSWFAEENGGEFIQGDISKNLAEHIRAWLFSPASRTKWYGSGNLESVNYESFVGKAKSILCEKYLSALVIDAGGTLNSVFSNPLIRQLRRIEALIHRIQKWPWDGPELSRPLHEPRSDLE